MANIQHIATRIFRHVDAGHLPVGYTLTMGALIDAYGDNPNFHEWVDAVPGSAVEKLIACMVRTGKWDDQEWLREYVLVCTPQGEALKESAA
ncbi:hypothetical protein [Acidithiobacillus ferriphilus]|jgi:hypothetical protein|uniref:hypothetical protein n=1 Tax=Acidithiobacillus ferriphilus TaxID=1689834 RepID=UPI001C0736F7|nr:hypothetical protein [Acidithiobacillus ferriphilus]MBU2853340.1 hypothetical protein [Acidithiobacillus ferriphilus]